MKILKINLFMLFLFGLSRLNSMNENLLFDHMHEKQKIEFLKQFSNDLRNKNKTDEEIIQSLNRVKIFDIDVVVGKYAEITDRILFERSFFESFSLKINIIRKNYDEYVHNDKHLHSFIINGNKFYRIYFDSQFYIKKHKTLRAYNVFCIKDKECYLSSNEEDYHKEEFHEAIDRTFKPINRFF